MVSMISAGILAIFLLVAVLIIGISLMISSGGRKKEGMCPLTDIYFGDRFVPYDLVRYNA